MQIYGRRFAKDREIQKSQKLSTWEKFWKTVSECLENFRQKPIVTRKASIILFNVPKGNFRKFSGK